MRVGFLHATWPGRNGRYAAAPARLRSETEPAQTDAITKQPDGTGASIAHLTHTGNLADADEANEKPRVAPRR